MANVEGYSHFHEDELHLRNPQKRVAAGLVAGCEIVHVLAGATTPGLFDNQASGG